MKKFLPGLVWIIVILITIHQMFFNTIRYTYIIIFALLLYWLTKKYYTKFSNIYKFFLILVSFLLFLSGYNIVEMFFPYPTIINSKSYDKAVKISNSIINYPVSREFHIHKDTTAITLHTDNTKFIDKIALDIADSELFDNSVKIGVYYRPSDNSNINKNRLEKCFDNRIKLINGVKHVETQIPEYNKVTINVVVDKFADKNRIYKIINNLLPMPDENKKILINEE